MSFQNPEFIWLLLLIPLAAVIDYLVILKKKRDLKQVAAQQTIEKLIRDISYTRRLIKRILIYAVFFVITLTLMRPQWGQKLITMERKGIDIVFLIDVSRSMLAEDIKPSRIEKAKMQISTFMDELQGDRVGLVIFAGSSFVSCPLTMDYNALKMFIDLISPDMVAKQGTLLGDALETARDCFDPLEKKHKAIILLTDGEDHDNSPIEQAQECAKEGIKIFAIGLGTTKGEPIPVRDRNGNISGYVKDRSGNIVMSHLDEITLQKVALETDGEYDYSAYGDLELERIYSKIQEKVEEKNLGSKKKKLREDRYQVFVIVTIVLLILEFILSDRKSIFSMLGARIEENLGRYE